MFSSEKISRLSFAVHSLLVAITPLTFSIVTAFFILNQFERRKINRSQQFQLFIFPESEFIENPFNRRTNRIMGKITIYFFNVIPNYKPD